MPLAADEIDAARPKAALRQDPLCVSQRDLLGPRIPVRGDPPQPLPAAAADDRHLAEAVQDLEHHRHVAASGPAMRFPPAAGAILELARQHWAASLELVQHVAPEAGVDTQEVAAAPLPRVLAAPPRHACVDQRQVLDRPDGRVPFEERPLLPQEPVELGRVVVAETAPEDELLRRRHRRDRVDLEEAQPPNRLANPLGRPVEQLRPDRDPPRLLDRDPNGSDADRSLCRHDLHPLRRCSVTPFEQFLGTLLPEPPAKVLDVGCGSGELTTALAVAGYDVLGIDPAAPDGDRFRRLKLEEVPAADGPYDAIVAGRSSTTSATSTSRSTRSSSCSPDGVLVLDEFAWDLMDEPTLDWFYGQKRALAAAGHGRAPRSLDDLRSEWEAEHVGLHGYDAMRVALDARFSELAFEWTPFLHRLLGGTATLALEQALVDADAIRPLGFRYAGAPGSHPFGLRRIGDGGSSDRGMGVGRNSCRYVVGGSIPHCGGSPCRPHSRTLAPARRNG